MDKPARDPNRCPTHPGAVLSEIVLPALGLPKTRIASHLGISRQTLYDLLSQKQPVTPRICSQVNFRTGPIYP